MKANIKKILIIAAGVLVFILRLTGDFILLSVEKPQLETNFVWNFVSVLLLIVIIIFYLIEENKSELKLPYEELSANFSYSFFQSTFLTATVLVIVLIFNSLMDLQISRGNYFNLIIKSFSFLYLILIAAVNLNFVFKWIWIRRKKGTKEFLYILGFASLILIILDTINHFTGNKQEIYQLVALFIMIFFLVGVAILIRFKMNWIATLSRNLKKRLFWMSFISTVTGILITVNSVSTDSAIFGELNRFYPLGSICFTISMILYSVYSSRLFLNVTITYPSTNIVERKSQEINSLAFLNKYVAESINKDNNYILSTVTGLAVKASNANGGWVEIYNDSVEIINAVNINENEIEKLHELFNLSEIFQKYSKTSLFESVFDSADLKILAGKIKNIGSLITIPIYLGGFRIGTIIVFKNDEYGMEQDDLQILSAFSDNIRIALENSRLMKESLEKERYKNEMMLAHEMQNKLLPQKLPKFESYSISAFNVPAAEVGGDYYDIVKLKNGKTCILIGDVSGKGISAAFYMAQLKGVVLSVSKEAEGAGDILMRINSVLFKNMESQMYITLSALVIDDNDGNFSMARAGHMPFIISDDKTIKMFTPKGLGIGLTKNEFFKINLEEIKIKINKNGAIILFTDGVNELYSMDGKQLGYEPLKKLLLDTSVNSASKYISKFEESIEKIMQNHRNHDDMTMVAIYYHGD